MINTRIARVSLAALIVAGLAGVTDVARLIEQAASAPEK